MESRVDVCHGADGFADNTFDFAGYALGVVDYFCLHRVQFACAKFIEHLVDKGQHRAVKLTHNRRMA